jgi:hypothetical protein
VAADTSSAAAAATPVVGPAAAALAAPIADLISAMFPAAVLINCGCMSKLVIGCSLHDGGIRPWYRRRCETDDPANPAIAVPALK